MRKILTYLIPGLFVGFFLFLLCLDEIVKTENSLELIVKGVFFALGVGIFIYAIFRNSKKIGYRNLKLKPLPKNIKMVRELPNDIDVFRFFWIASSYRMIENRTDIIAAMLLKWINDGIVEVNNTNDGDVFVFNEHNFDNELENQLYQLLQSAASNNILPYDALVIWIRENYENLLKWTIDILEYENKILKKEGHLILKKRRDDLLILLDLKDDRVYYVDSSVIDDAIKIKGFKKFLLYISNMDDKEIKDIHLWDEYLMYAQILGVANKIADKYRVETKKELIQLPETLNMADIIANNYKLSGDDDE